jgi:phosphoribosylformimino-5-aminoimidazole carboxamide ribotide isomerase
MKILPAIDILDGKVVRLFQGDYEKATFYSHNPLQIATTFAKQGYASLHVIDLAGARSGTLQAMKEIEAILSTGLEIQVGGGIRTCERVRDLLTMGVRRVIIGTQALVDPSFVDALIQNFPKDALVVSIDIRNGKIATHGWLEEHSHSLDDTIRRLEKQGIRQIIITDITRDGTLQGANFSLYRPLVRAFRNLEFYAAGGLRGQFDIEQLRQIGVAGVIIGRSFYEHLL